MKYLEGAAILTTYDEVGATDSAVVIAHQCEGNSDPETGLFITVSPLLNKLASTREAMFDIHDELRREGDMYLADTEHQVLDTKRAIRGMRIAERFKSIGTTPLEVTIDADQIPEASEALRQMILKYREMTAHPDTEPTTLDEACALRYGETAAKIFGLMTAQ